MKKKNIVICIVLIIAIVAIIVSIKTMKNNSMEKLAFTEENYKYMYNDIISSFGNGEEFHIVKTTEEFVEDSLIKVGGKKISFIGYFDSQENMYIVVYAKYLEDKPIYKNGEAGNIIRITANSNYSKDAYLNGGQNND